ncbi:MAG: Ig-like domain-containing protein, partial [Candidatus Poribacteria bacterium]
LCNQSAIQQYDIVRKGAAAPPVFDPVDPITNVADVSITGSGVDLGATVSVVVNGAPVETFVTDTTFATTLVTLREGENVITATATDAVGNQATSDTLNISLDTTPPEAFFLDPVPDTTTAATQDVISVSFSDAIGVEPTSVTLDVDGVTVTPTVTTDGLTFQAPAPFSAGVDGDVGNHHAVVTLQDIAGNQTTKLLNFSVDGTPPSIEGLVPNQGEVVTVIEPQVSATIVAQDVDPDSVEVLVGPVGGTLESVVGLTTIFDFNVTSGQITYTPVFEDLTTYQVIVSASDLVGNSAEASWTFTVDTSADDTTDPNITVGFPQPGDSVNSAGLDILSFTTVDGSSGVDPDNVSLFLNDSQGDSPLILGQLEESGLAQFNRETGEATVNIRRILLIAMAAAKGGFNFDPLELNSLERSLGGGGASFDPLELNSLERSIDTGDPSSVASLERSLNTGANLLSTGTNEIGVQVTDLSGNVSFATWTFDVVLDPPDPPNFGALPASTNQSDFTVTGLVPNLAGALPVTIALRVNSSPVGVTEITELDGVFAIANVRLAEGDNTLTATAQDSTGNLSDRSEPFSISVDLTPPTLHIDTAPAASAGDTTRIAGRVSDDRPEGVVELVVVVNGVETPLAIAPTFDATVTLAGEENSILVRATDLAGNVTSSDTYTVSVDLIPPTTAPTDLVAVPTADARGLVVAWTADPEATTYNVYRSGVTITDATDLTPVGAGVSVASYTDTALPAGSTVYYAVTSVDAAGNEDKAVASAAYNVAWMRVEGGTATLGDGTSLAAPDRALFTNVLRTAAVSFGVEPPEGTPSLDDSVEGTYREVSVRAATEAIDTFAQAAALTIPTTNASAVVYQLVDGEWIALESTGAAGAVSTQITLGGVYQLASVGIPGDVNGDGVVDIRDLVTVATAFGKSVEAGDPADLNRDGVVNIADLVTVATNFGKGSRSLAAPARVTGGASVRLSLSANRLSADLSEVIVTAETSETVAGYEMRVS